MRIDRTRWIILVSAAALLSVPVGCGGDSRPDPKTTVTGLFTAMRASDSLYIADHIDLQRAIASLPEDAALDPALKPGDALIGALTGEGHLKKRWLSNQIVIGASQVTADTGWVEVSFIDRLTRVQYYNKMRLEFRNSRWVITAFRTL